MAKGGKTPPIAQDHEFEVGKLAGRQTQESASKSGGQDAPDKHRGDGRGYGVGGGDGLRGSGASNPVRHGYLKSHESFTHGHAHLPPAEHAEKGTGPGGDGNDPELHDADGAPKSSRSQKPLGVSKAGSVGDVDDMPGNNKNVSVKSKVFKHGRG